MAHYLDKHDLLTKVTVLSNVETVSQDTYDEHEILQSILGANPTELFACALQFAVVGMGNQSFGKVKIDGQEHGVEGLLQKNNVLIRNPSQSRLEPGDLTIKRLSRFFRFHISQHIEESSQESFLFRKYAEEGEAQYTFPGAEYMVEQGQTSGLLSAYLCLDAAEGTHFSERIKTILATRKVQC
jgi:hypothetical protein